jgi:hypothetical protein
MRLSKRSFVRSESAHKKWELDYLDWLGQKSNQLRERPGFVVVSFTRRTDVWYMA